MKKISVNFSRNLFYLSVGKKTLVTRYSPGTRMQSRSSRQSALMCPNNLKVKLLHNFFTTFGKWFEPKKFVNRAIIVRQKSNMIVISKAEKTILDFIKSLHINYYPFWYKGNRQWNRIHSNYRIYVNPTFVHKRVV